MKSSSIAVYVILIVAIFFLLKNISNMNIFSIIIIVFIIVAIFMYMSTSSDTLQDMQNGQTASKIDASSLATNGTNVPATNFAYSIWIYVNDFNYRYGKPKVIFGRMGGSSTAGTGNIPIDGVDGIDPCPLVVLGAIENNIDTVITCYSKAGTTVPYKCTIPNVPIQKWTNLIISVYGRSLDTYLDGKLVRTCLLPGTASVNSNANVYVTPGGGFDGWTSKFQYFANPLNPQEAYNLYAAGYGGGSSAYQIQISLIENGTTQSSTTI